MWVLGRQLSLNLLGFFFLFFWLLLACFCFFICFNRQWLKPWDPELRTHSKLFCFHFCHVYMHCFLTNLRHSDRSEVAEPANDLQACSELTGKCLLHFPWHRVSKPSILHQPVHWSTDNSWEPSKFSEFWAGSQGSPELAAVCWRWPPHWEAVPLGWAPRIRGSGKAGLGLAFFLQAVGFMSLKGKFG